MVFGTGSWSRLCPYALGAIVAGLASLASLAPAPLWSPPHLLLPFYPAVLLSAWLGGLGPGLLTTVLSALAIISLPLPPSRSLMLLVPGDLMGFILFLSVGFLISALHAQLQAAQRHAEAVTREVQREIEERRTMEAVARRFVTLSDELQTSIERYRQQIGSLAAVFRAQRDGRIVACNDLFVRLVGAASSEQVLRLNMRDVFLDPARWRKVTASLTPEVVISTQELSWQRNDGTPLTVLASLRESDGLVEGVAIDVTDRKRAEEADRQVAIIEKALGAI